MPPDRWAWSIGGSPRQTPPASPPTTPIANRRPPVIPPARITEDNRHGTNFHVDRIFRADAPQSGGGGSSGTVDDVMKMLEVYNGHGAHLKPETVAEAFKNQIGTLPRRESDAGKRFTLL